MVMCHVSEGAKLFAYQITTRYLNLWLTYCYFLFLKANGRPNESLLPVSILTSSKSSACDTALAYQNFPNWMIADGVMTSYRFFKMAAIASQIYFRFLAWPCLTSKKARSYWHTKFRSDTSIHGRDITTSGS